MKYVYVLYVRNCDNGEIESLHCFSSMKKVKGFMEKYLSGVGEFITIPGTYYMYCHKQDLNGKTIGFKFAEYRGIF